VQLTSDIFGAVVEHGGRPTKFQCDVENCSSCAAGMWCRDARPCWLSCSGI